MLPVILLIICVIITPVGNLLLKSGMNECGSIAEAEGGVVQYYGNVFTKWQILLGGVVYIMSALMWMAVLGMMDITAAYPIFISGAFLIVTVAAAILFGEHLSVVRVIGIAIVIAGIFIVSVSVPRHTPPDSAASSPQLRAEVQDDYYSDPVQHNVDNEGQIG